MRPLTRSPTCGVVERPPRADNAEAEAPLEAGTSDVATDTPQPFDSTTPPNDGETDSGTVDAPTFPTTHLDTFTTIGESTYGVPATVSTIVVDAWGAGGGGTLGAVGGAGGYVVRNRFKGR